MTSLKHYERDLGLPARLGDTGLVLPDEQELCELVGSALCDGGPDVTEARLLFTRWKPGNSLLGTWSVSFADGSERTVSLKRYVGGKDRDVAESFRVNRHMEEGAAPLRPYAYLEESSSILTVFPVDRVLRGAARARDLRRTGRMLDDAGLWPGLVMRRRSSRLDLLRFKPERRAVLSLRALLKERTDGGSRAAGERRLGVRVLEAEEAQEVARRRELCAFEGFPALLHVEPATGLLVEEWVEGEPFGSEEFDHAVGAARVLGALHRQPTSGLAPVQVKRDRSGVLELLARVPELHARALVLPVLEPREGRSWVHGDFHPDQLTQTTSGMRLLDADALRAGAPEEDLASWIADRLESAPELSCRAVLDELLSGYGAGADEIDADWVQDLVREELLARAAAGLRRLQAGAVERAQALIERAEALAAEGDTRTAPIPRALAAVAAEHEIAPGDVLRSDLDREGSVLLECEAAGVHRWFKGSEALVELSFREDRKLPLCAQLDWDDPALELIGWRPGRRIALRAVEGGVGVILKGLRRKRVAQALEAFERVHQALQGPEDFVVPRVHLDEDRSALRLELVELPAVELGGESSAVFHQVGSALRAFQQKVGVEGLALHDDQQELKVLGELAQRHASGMGELPAGWARQFARLAALPRPARTAWTAAHRDLHDGQLLAGGGRVGLLDFDLLCSASPWLDLANLTAHLSLRAVQGLAGATHASAELCSAALLEGYGPPGRDADRREFQFYQAATFLRLALVYSLRPRWHAISAELLERGTSVLDAIDVD